MTLPWLNLAAPVPVVAVGIALSLLLVGAGGCAEPSGPRTVYNRDLSVKAPAIKRAVARSDLTVAAELVKNLDSDDPAVRFYAVEGLRRLTGEDFGYLFYQEKEQRRPAVERWRRWLQANQHEGREPSAD
jgi:hypothetical protein